MNLKRGSARAVEPLEYEALSAIPPRLRTDAAAAETLHECLPADHEIYFVSDAVEQMDLSAIWLPAWLCRPLPRDRMRTA